MIAPLTAAFEQAMADCGSFEPNPLLAVAVSGGADSLALTLLADAWARARGGQVVGLTVDHGLRPDSAWEAQQVSAWLAHYGIEHHTLPWINPTLSGGMQAKARLNRYELLNGWCARHGCLHLLTGHHQDDQAETFLLRLAAGSGPRGLAAMAMSHMLPACRLLRPLLAIPKRALGDYLRQRGQGWIDDPSNHNPAYHRTHWRQQQASMADLGLNPDRLCHLTRQFGVMRVMDDRVVDGLLAQAILGHGVGWLTLDPHALQDAPQAERDAALGRLIAHMGGLAHAPSASALARASERLGQAMTLGGVRFMPLKSGAVLLVREVRNLTRLTLAPGDSALWDGRFQVSLARHAPGPVQVEALGRRILPDGACMSEKLPPPQRAARATLPIFTRGEVVEYRADFARDSDPNEVYYAFYRPQMRLTHQRFHLALSARRIM